MIAHMCFVCVWLVFKEDDQNLHDSVERERLRQSIEQKVRENRARQQVAQSNEPQTIELKNEWYVGFDKDIWFDCIRIFVSLSRRSETFRIAKLGLYANCLYSAATHAVDRYHKKLFRFYWLIMMMLRASYRCCGKDMERIRLDLMSTICVSRTLKPSIAVIEQHTYRYRDNWIKHRAPADV